MNPAMKSEVINYEDIPETVMGMKLLIIKDDLVNFKELIQRGAQTWADASPEIKELADLITNGMVMQDYRALASPKPVVIDVTSTDYKPPTEAPPVSDTAVEAVDEVSAAAVDKAYDPDFPSWGQAVISKYGPDPRPPILSFRVSSNGERLTVLFEGDTAAKNFFQPKE